jgi:voltage-gated potassium channel
MSKSQKRRRRFPLEKTLFLDLFRDPKSRPIFIYVVLFITVSASLFHWLEDWSWLDSFYFVVVTFTTIGYGDFTPTLPITKLITIFVGLNGVAILLLLFDEIRRVRSWERVENQ